MSSMGVSAPFLISFRLSHLFLIKKLNSLHTWGPCVAFVSASLSTPHQRGATLGVSSPSRL